MRASYRLAMCTAIYIYVYSVGKGDTQWIHRELLVVVDICRAIRLQG